MIRKVLDDMMKYAGYGRFGLKYGEGEPPIGWPVSVSWKGYKGAAKSQMSNQELTVIIGSLLVAAGLDPATHVEKRYFYFVCLFV